MTPGSHGAQTSMCIFPSTTKQLTQFSADTDPMCHNFNSILTLSAWGWCQIPQVKASVPEDCPTSDINFRSRLLPVFLTTGSKDPTSFSLGFINLLQQLTKLRKPVYLLDYEFVTKGIKGYE